MHEVLVYSIHIQAWPQRAFFFSFFLLSKRSLKAFTPSTLYRQPVSLSLLMCVTLHIGV